MTGHEQPVAPTLDPFSESGDVIISVRGLRVTYGDRQVLNGIDLDIRRGEAMVILGVSGCGKSTLLRQMEGLDRPSAGSIRIKDVDLQNDSAERVAEIRRVVGVSFQSAAMFNSMTVGDNVALPLREHTKLAESTIRLIARMKLQQVGLLGIENLYPTELSGGMRKRASLARALALDPEILFFDEPSAGLDPIIGAGIDRLILGLKRAYRITMVVVTHEMESAFLIADRMCVLDEGRILAVGTRDEIRGHPNPRIQQFVHRIPDHEPTETETYLSGMLGHS